MTCSTGWGEWCADCPLSVCCKANLVKGEEERR
jgi:hypothetical protein